MRPDFININQVLTSSFAVFVLHKILPFSHSLTIPLAFRLCPIMEEIKRTFAQCKKEARAALVTYVTAGYPTTDETVEILKGMEAGGAGKLF